MWTWFAACAKESFVNCLFRENGPCINTRHEKSGAAHEEAPERASKKVRQ
jgi:hypothetical protein